MLLEREKLVKQLEASHHECDIYKEVLACNSKEDVTQIIEEFFPNQKNIPPIHNDEKDYLIKRINILKNYEAQRVLGKIAILF